MFFLSGINDSSLAVIVLLVIALIGAVYSVLIGILYCLNFKKAYDSWTKKLFLVVIAILLLFFVLYLNYNLSGKGILE